MSARLALVVGLLLATPAAAQEEGRHPRYLTRHDYADDGAFVHWPATAVGMVAFIAFGSAATAACAPFDLLRALTVPHTWGEVAENCGTLAGETAGNGTYILVGAPFWAVRQVTWDGPRRLLRRSPPEPPDDVPAS